MNGHLLVHPLAVVGGLRADSISRFGRVTIPSLHHTGLVGLWPSIDDGPCTLQPDLADAEFFARVVGQPLKLADLVAFVQDPDLRSNVSTCFDL